MKKNRKLLFQVGIITILIFISTLAFTLISDYSITKESYLESKQEMIDGDLINLRNSVENNRNLTWFFDYMEKNPDSIKRSVTEEERIEYESEEFIDGFFDIYFEDGTDYYNASEKIQFWISRNIFAHFSTIINMMNYEMQYDSIYVIDVINEDESFFVMETYQEDDYYNDNDDSMSDGDALYDGEEYISAYSNFSKFIEYPASKHSAVKEILSGKNNSQSETIYETYHDSETGKEYYIGYIPIRDDGNTVGYLCIKYDWSDFSKELINHMNKSMITGLIVLIIINGLLILFLYRKAINPVQKVKSGVEEYMKDKNSEAVAEKMSKITVRNEIGVLADSFADMTKEIDRYTKEIINLNDEKSRIQTELSLASTIQNNMLPNQFPAFPDRTEFEVFASMDAAKNVGGDFYDFFLIDDDHLALLIADVSGKGIPASLFMMSSMIMFRDLTEPNDTPAEVLERVNNKICANNDANMFVTVWMGILEISTGKVTAANAGHEYPMVKSNGKYELLKDRHGLPIGAMEMSRYRNYELTLQSGDGIFVYTDGVAEASDSDHTFFGLERTLKTLNENPNEEPEALLKKVRASIDTFVKDEPQFDDLTMLVLKYNG